MIRRRINNSTQIVVIERCGRPSTVECDRSIRVIDLLLVRQDQVQVQIGLGVPDQLSANNAGAAYVDDSAAGTC